jgi:hypothetical protein
VQTQVAKDGYSLDALLAGITPTNCHAETNWGAPQGREEWPIDWGAPLEPGTRVKPQPASRYK